jgi:hypothetical protein
LQSKLEVQCLVLTTSYGRCKWITHTQRNFRVDANKEYDWDASVVIRTNHNFAPNKNSKLVAQLDVKTFSNRAL